LLAIISQPLVGLLSFAFYRTVSSDDYEPLASRSRVPQPRDSASTVASSFVGDDFPSYQGGYQNPPPEESFEQ